jgi:hypothetical protein
MARIRTIKPEFFTSLSIADLTPEQRLTFIGLWTHVDDEGRCVDDPRLIKAALWPLDDRTATDVERDLGVLSEASLILRYTLNRKRYLAVTNWHEHQRISRPSQSKLPSPEEGDPTPPTCANEPSLNPHGGLSEGSAQERNRERNREQGTGKGTGNREETSSPSSELAPRASDTEPRPDIERLCTHLADRIEANGSKRPTVTQKWRDAARLMLDRDDRTEEQIRGAIDWCQADEFWRRNVMSMPKLREQYDRLRLQAEGRRTAAAPRPSTSDQRSAQAQAAGGSGRVRSLAEIVNGAARGHLTIPGEIA